MRDFGFFLRFFTLLDPPVFRENRIHDVLGRLNRALQKNWLTRLVKGQDLCPDKSEKWLQGFRFAKRVLICGGS
jgi:hypothetical protein